MGCPPPLRPKRAAQTAAQGFAPADTPTTTGNQKKRDISNEVRKGTFLKRFDTQMALSLTKREAAGTMKKPRWTCNPGLAGVSPTALVPEWRNWQTR